MTVNTRLVVIYWVDQYNDGHKYSRHERMMNVVQRRSLAARRWHQQTQRQWDIHNIVENDENNDSLC